MQLHKPQPVKANGVHFDIKAVFSLQVEKLREMTLVGNLFQYGAP